MIDPSSSAPTIEYWIERLRAGDERARTELLRHAEARLMRLTRRISKDFGRLGRWEQTEDVCQNASLRLWNALKAAHPATAADFYRLAAMQVRRELLDLVRRHFGPEGIGVHHATNSPEDALGRTPPPAYDRADSTHEPVRVAAWSDFHRQADTLPADQRDVFDLIWYEGLSQNEAAEVLGLSLRTIQRRWMEARIAISQALGGESPT